MRRSERERRDIEEQEAILSGGRPLTIWAVEAPSYKTLESVLGSSVRASLFEAISVLDMQVDNLIQQFIEESLRFPTTSVEHEVKLRCEVYVDGVARYQIVQNHLGTLVSEPAVQGKKTSVGFRPAGPKRGGRHAQGAS